MPPKPAAKKGKEEQEDFSDVPSLPHLNSVIFTLIYKSFFASEVREKLQKHVADSMPLDRVKTLTRDDILAYAKAKQIILEPNVIPTIP